MTARLPRNEKTGPVGALSLVGNLNANRAHSFEGDALPVRLRMKGRD
jgi:hypothetical protein